VKPTTGDVIFRRMDLSKADLAAVKFVQHVYGLPTFIAAVRLSLRQQALRDQVMGCPRRQPSDPDGYAATLLVGGRPEDGVYKELVQGIAHGDGGDVLTVKMGDHLNPRLFRFWPDDEKHMASVQSGWGFLCNVEAVRFSLRVQAVLAGWPRTGKDGW